MTTGMMMEREAPFPESLLSPSRKKSRLHHAHWPFSWQAAREVCFEQTSSEPCEPAQLAMHRNSSWLHVGVTAHEGRSPRSQQLPVPHGAARSESHQMAKHVATSQRSGGNVPVM